MFSCATPLLGADISGGLLRDTATWGGVLRNTAARGPKNSHNNWGKCRWGIWLGAVTVKYPPSCLLKVFLLIPPPPSLIACRLCDWPEEGSNLQFQIQGFYTQGHLIDPNIYIQEERINK